MSKWYSEAIHHRWKDNAMKKRKKNKRTNN